MLLNDDFCLAYGRNNIVDKEKMQVILVFSCFPTMFSEVLRMGVKIS